jgi:hypothetical protein
LSLWGLVMNYYNYMHLDPLQIVGNLVSWNTVR